jgi:hypothetical protein
MMEESEPMLVDAFVSTTSVNGRVFCHPGSWDLEIQGNLHLQFQSGPNWWWRMWQYLLLGWRWRRRDV